MPEEKERSSSFKIIVITALITGAVSVITGMILFYLQRGEPRLTYDFKDTIPFMGDKEKLAIYQVTIRNSGKKMVNSIDCCISIEPASIKEKQLSLQPTIKFQDNISGGKYDIHLNYLNPMEEVIILLLASAQGLLPSKPSISLRGEGIIGQKALEGAETSSFGRTLRTTTLSAYAVVTILGSILLLYRRKQRFSIGEQILLKAGDISKHSGEQNEILAYIYGLHGMTNEQEVFLNRTRKASYWSEADRISSIALKSTNEREIETYKKILYDLLNYARIADESMAIIHYNIAKIAMRQKLQYEFDIQLAEAKKIAPKLIEIRLNIDPIFAETEYQTGVTISSAIYGKGKATRDVTDKLQNAIVRGKLTGFMVKNDILGGDPAPNIKKELNVVYYYKNKKYTKMIAEGDSFSLP